MCVRPWYMSIQIHTTSATTVVLVGTNKERRPPFAMGPVIDPRLCITCSAPTNIAVIKYWGKDSIALNTPINSSASVTLCQV